MKIRRATIDDLDHVARLGLAFINAAGMPPATLDECKEFCTKLLTADEGVAFISERGVIAGVLSPLYYKPSYKLAAELFWRAEDGNGLALLRAFEDWAGAEGANDIRLSTLDYFSSPIVEKLLVRRGYALHEKGYCRGLS